MFVPMRHGGGRRMSIGDNSILGDRRWAGMYGVHADFVARENCKIVCVAAADVMVRGRLRFSRGPGRGILYLFR